MVISRLARLNNLVLVRLVDLVLVSLENLVLVHLARLDNLVLVRLETWSWFASVTWFVFKISVIADMSSDSKSTDAKTPAPPGGSPVFWPLHVFAISVADLSPSWSASIT